MFKPIFKGLLKSRASNGDINFLRIFFIYDVEDEPKLLTYPA